MLPDLEAVTTQHTHTQSQGRDPLFNEVFYFTCTSESLSTNRAFHCALWNQDQTAEAGPPSFLGHCTIPLGPVICKKMTNRWYSLALDEDSDLIQLPSKRLSRKATEEEKRNKTREFAKNIQKNSSDTVHPKKPHTYVDKNYALVSCAHCSTMMIGAHSSCMECHIAVHNKCQDLMAPTCGSMGAIRLSINFTKLIVLESETYKDMVSVLKENDFQLLNVLGKFSQYREEVARCMIRIMDDTASEFVRSCIRQEIMASDDPKTLFRANSMASKSLDVYMKHVGTDYLRQTLENVLKLVVISKKPFEMDPTRLESVQSKDKKKPSAEESLLVNGENLKELNIIICDCIFGSVNKMPK